MAKQKRHLSLSILFRGRHQYRRFEGAIAQLIALAHTDVDSTSSFPGTAFTRRLSSLSSSWRSTTSFVDGRVHRWSRRAAGSVAPTPEFKYPRKAVKVA